MASFWLVSLFLAYLLCINQLAAAANVTESDANRDKGTWPGRKLKQLQPASVSSGGRALLDDGMCLYGGSQTLSSGSSTYFWQYKGEGKQGQLCGLLGEPDNVASPQRVVTAYGLAVSQDTAGSSFLIITDYDAFYASQPVYFISGSIKKWNLNTKAPAGVLVYPAPNITQSWLDFFYDACPIKNKQTKTCLTNNIYDAVASLWNDPNTSSNVTQFIGDCLSQPNSNPQCISAALNRTVATIHTPRDTEQDLHAPWGPEGIYLDKMRKMLYVADFTGVSDVPGSVRAYEYTTEGVGKWVFDFNIPPDLSTRINGAFSPRSIAARPDEPAYIYVTARNLNNGLLGWVFKYNVETRLMQEIFITANGPELPMHRPDGIVWGPGDTWYVAAFRADAGDNDRIMAFNGKGQWLPEKTIITNTTLPDGAIARAYTQTLAIHNHNIYMSDQVSGEIRAYPIPDSNNKEPMYTVFHDGSVTGSVWPMVWGPCPDDGCRSG